jgi:hypothetical protein
MIANHKSENGSPLLNSKPHGCQRKLESTFAVSYWLRSACGGCRSSCHDITGRFARVACGYHKLGDSLHHRTTNVIAALDSHDARVLVTATVILSANVVSSDKG